MGYLDNKGLSHLWGKVKAALAAKQDTLTGLPGQVVGFDASGAALAVPGRSNRNLIINWDFRNSVNRNGKMGYTQNGITIDTWLSYNCSVCLEDDGIVVSRLNNSTDAHFYYINPQNNFLTGKTVTLSVLVDELDGTCNITGFDVSKSLEPGINSITGVWNDLNAFWLLNYLDGTIKIRAVKLELGDHQTLASQNEDGEWEIIDPPDYDLQYALCSLYSPSTGEWVGYQHSNPNLLDNWYFIDPINQRGQTEYLAAGYTIDRWKIFGSNSKAIIENGRVILAKKAAGYVEITQLSDRPIKAGAPLSFSILTDENLYSVYLPARWAYDGRAVDTAIADYKFLQIAATTENMIKCTIYISSGSPADATISILAVKLELGDTQTLAHQDTDGNWVLNDPPPNKALELVKCQRYFIRVGNTYGENGTNIQNVVGIANGTLTTHAVANIALPVSLRATPTVTFKNVKLRSGTSDVSVASMTSFTITHNGLYCGFWVESGLTPGADYVIRCSDGGYIDIDANL